MPSNENGDPRLKLASDLVKNMPFAVILGLVLWFVGTRVVTLGEQMIILQAKQSSAVEHFAVAIEKITTSNERRVVSEAKQHDEIVSVFKSMNERRDKEILILTEILIELKEQ